MNATIIDGESENHPFFITGSAYLNSTIRNMTFANGNYYNSLLMIYYSDSIRFENIKIQDCVITDYGAALASSTAGGNVQLRDVTVNNIDAPASFYSGVVFNGTTFFKATDCNFSNNHACHDDVLSAGLYVMSSGDIIVENCKFFDNSTTSTIWQGWASAFMNVDYNDELGDTYINNCLFYDNVNINGKSTISAKSLYNSTVHFTNNTVVNNESEYGIEFQGNIEFSNNILRNDGEYEIVLFDKSGQGIISVINISNSNIEGGLNAIYNQNGVNIVNWLEGNIDEDPLFFGTLEHPYQLSPFSPCVDAGTPDTTGLYLPPWDLLHNERVWDGDNNGTAIIDMGCYEFGAPSVSSYEEVIQLNEINLYNFPNPFNPTTTISFSIPNDSNVELSIFNIKGQKVKTLAKDVFVKGFHKLTWNGKDSSGKSVSSGIYFYKLKAGDYQKVRKLILLK